METAAYRRSLLVELASHRENARDGQAAAVLAELERTGGVPDDVRPAGENTSQKAPRERAVTKKAG